MSDPSTAAPGQQGTLGGIFRDYIAKVRGGDIGSLPAILGLLVLVVVFSVLRPDTFTTKLNVANLVNQSSAIIVLAMGLVFVLLIGEIDLSAGYTAGVGATVIGVTATRHGWAWPLAIIAGLVVGAFIGFVLGNLVARIGIPSFVATLAAYLGFQGVMLKVIGEGGTIPYQNDTLIKINNGNLSVTTGWILAIVGVVAYGVITFLSLQRRRKRGLVANSVLAWALKTGFLAVLVLGGTAYLSQERSIRPDLKSL
jgi:D-xylose transport system permease protein